MAWSLDAPNSGRADTHIYTQNTQTGACVCVCVCVYVGGYVVGMGLGGNLRLVRWGVRRGEGGAQLEG